MEYNNSINTRRIRGNKYIQDEDGHQFNDKFYYNPNGVNHTVEMDNQIIDPRQFTINPYGYNYREETLGYDSYEIQRDRDRCECEKKPCNCEKKPCHCEKEDCKKVCEKADVTHTSCSKIGCNNTTTQCCDGTVAPPITSANSMPFAIQTYTISDSIKFDRIATSSQAVISANTIINKGITVTGEPLEKGKFKFKVEEICFEDFDLDICTGETTLEGNAVSEEQKLESDFSLLVRSAINTNCKTQCNRQGRGTNLQFSQNELKVTIQGNNSSQHKPHLTDEFDEAKKGHCPPNPCPKKINLTLKGSCGCTKIEVKTKICLPNQGLEFSYPELTASLCRKANMTFAVLDQLYQTKLTLGCINATIEKTDKPGQPYEVEILNEVKASVLLRETVNLLNYELISVLGSSQRVNPRDIPVTALDFDFDTCL